MMETFKIHFEHNTYQLTYTRTAIGNDSYRYIIYNKEAELLKFAPHEFEIIYSPRQYPNWKFIPSFGNRFDNLRVAIILALIDKYPDQ